MIYLTIYHLMSNYLFSAIYDINVFAGELNEDLKEVSEWAFQGKMIFNPDASKQAQEVIFSRKIKKKHSSYSGFQQCYCVSN